jgi:hypothetical protein
MALKTSTSPTISVRQLGLRADAGIGDLDEGSDGGPQLARVEGLSQESGRPGLEG